jgi:hypothetical protein
VQVYTLLYALSPREISAVLRPPSVAFESSLARSSRRRGLAPKSKLLAHFSKTQREVIYMTVAVAMSHAMFSARFDRGAMSAADRSIGYGRFHKGKLI